MLIQEPPGSVFPRKEKEIASEEAKAWKTSFEPSSRLSKVCNEIKASPEVAKEMNDLAGSLGPTATVLGDKTWQIASPEEFDRLQQFFDAPPNPNERLRRTMNTPSRWKA